MMTDDVTAKLIELLSDYQDEGEGTKNPITKGTCPLGGVAGFESDFIPEIVRRLAREVLGEPLPKGTRVKNIFVDSGRKLTVEEISKKFTSVYVPKGVKV